MTRTFSPARCAGAKWRRPFPRTTGRVGSAPTGTWRLRRPALSARRQRKRGKTASLPRRRKRRRSRRRRRRRRLRSLWSLLCLLLRRRRRRRSRWSSHRCSFPSSSRRRIRRGTLVGSVPGARSCRCAPWGTSRGAGGYSMSTGSWCSGRSRTRRPSSERRTCSGAGSKRTRRRGGAMRGPTCRRSSRASGTRIRGSSRSFPSGRARSSGTVARRRGPPGRRCGEQQQKTTLSCRPSTDAASGGIRTSTSTKRPRRIRTEIGTTSTRTSTKTPVSRATRVSSTSAAPARPSRAPPSSSRGATATSKPTAREAARPSTAAPSCASPPRKTAPTATSAPSRSRL
mmetsp:Transcript_13713/g.44723  ORF Transcript_13713/g.44723 Transcript_13713/m.44723 type:complete len:342 (-) Transcript_13713:350-1375(-)